jgi:hypothetical protein
MAFHDWKSMIQLFSYHRQISLAERIRSDENRKRLSSDEIGREAEASYNTGFSDLDEVKFIDLNVGVMFVF